MPEGAKERFDGGIRRAVLLQHSEVFTIWLQSDHPCRWKATGVPDCRKTDVGPGVDDDARSQGVGWLIAVSAHHMLESPSVVPAPDHERMFDAGPSHLSPAIVSAARPGRPEPHATQEA